jgi:hypothetical protein
MSVDYRIYATAYVLLVLAWCASLHVLARYGHEAAGRWMMLVSSAALITGAANVLDWLWS